MANEETAAVEQQADTAKEVKKVVRADQKATEAGEDKFIKAASNPPREDKKYVEKGDLLVPVE